MHRPTRFILAAAVGAACLLQLPVQAQVQSPGKDPSMVATGSPIPILRNMRHGGYKVVNGMPRLLTVPIIDKDKPLNDTTLE